MSCQCIRTKTVAGLGVAWKKVEFPLGAVAQGLLTCWLLRFTNASGPIAVDWQVSLDEAGDVPYTGVGTAPLWTGRATGTSGAARLMAGVPVPGGATSVWLWLKTNAGTLDAEIDLYGDLP